MTDADEKAGDAVPLHCFRSGSGEGDARRTAGVADDLNVAPGAASAESAAEGFGNRFFCRPASGDELDFVAAPFRFFG